MYQSKSLYKRDNKPYNIKFIGVGISTTQTKREDKKSRLCLYSPTITKEAKMDELTYQYISEKLGKFFTRHRSSFAFKFIEIILGW